MGARWTFRQSDSSAERAARGTDAPGVVSRSLKRRKDQKKSSEVTTWGERWVLFKMAECETGKISPTGHTTLGGILLQKPHGNEPDGAIFTTGMSSVHVNEARVKGFLSKQRLVRLSGRRRGGDHWDSPPQAPKCLNPTVGKTGNWKPYRMQEGRQEIMGVTGRTVRPVTLLMGYVLVRRKLSQQ